MSFLKRMLFLLLGGFAAWFTGFALGSAEVSLLTTFVVASFLATLWYIFYRILV